MAGGTVCVANDPAGLRILALGVREWPELVATFDTACGAHGVAVRGRFAYVVDSLHGTTVVDVANATGPTCGTRFDAPGPCLDAGSRSPRTYAKLRM